MLRARLTGGPMCRRNTSWRGLPERMTAAEKLTDRTLAQKVFADIAKNCSDWYLRREAAKKMTDKNILAALRKIAGSGIFVKNLLTGFSQFQACNC
jgi:hypothetical protein